MSDNNNINQIPSESIASTDESIEQEDGPTPLPAGITLEDILRHLATQQQSGQHNLTDSNSSLLTGNSNREPPTKEQVNEILNKQFSNEEFVNSETNDNKYCFRCIYCNEIILLKNVAKSIEIHELFSGGGGNLVNVNNNWQINNKMSFENIAVTRPVGATEATAGTHKYLACGSCDRGPIGITYIAQPNIFYINHGRVKYTEK